MEVSENRIKLHWWQFVLIVIVALSAIGAMTFATINGQKVQVEKIKAEQQEKSERGHWLWGRWHDRVKVENQNERDKQ